MKHAVPELPEAPPDGVFKYPYINKPKYNKVLWRLCIQRIDPASKTDTQLNAQGRQAACLPRLQRLFTRLAIIRFSPGREILKRLWIRRWIEPQNRTSFSHFFHHEVFVGSHFDGFLGNFLD